jgi:hypothetical protein
MKDQLKTPAPKTLGQKTLSQKQLSQSGAGATSQNLETTDDIDWNKQLTCLEDLVDELVKDNPQETRIRTCMNAAGLPYTTDPVERMNCVLNALEGARSAETGNKGRGQEPTV